MKVAYGIDVSGRKRRTKKEIEEQAEEFRKWQDQYYDLDFQKGQELLLTKMWSYMFDAVRCCLTSFTKGNGSQEEYIEAATYGADDICNRYTKSKKRMMRGIATKKDPYKKDYPLTMCWWEAKNIVLSRRCFTEVAYDKLHYEDLTNEQLKEVSVRY